MDSNLPLVEQYHAAAVAFVDAQAAAEILEASKETILSQRIMELLRADPKMSVAKAEVKASVGWADYICGMVDARKKANKLRVERDIVKMKFSTWICENADARVAARL